MNVIFGYTSTWPIDVRVASAYDHGYDQGCSILFNNMMTAMIRDLDGQPEDAGLDLSPPRIGLDLHQEEDAVKQGGKKERERNNVLSFHVNMLCFESIHWKYEYRDKFPQKK